MKIKRKNTKITREISMTVEGIEFFCKTEPKNCKKVCLVFVCLFVVLCCVVLCCVIRRKVQKYGKKKK